MKTIPAFGIGYLNLSQLKLFLLHLCSRLKRKDGLGLTRMIGNNLSTVLQEHQKTNRNIPELNNVRKYARTDICKYKLYGMKVVTADDELPDYHNIVNSVICDGISSLPVTYIE